MTKNKDLNAAIDTLLKTYKTPEEIIGENGLLQQLTKAVLQRGRKIRKKNKGLSSDFSR